MENYLQDEVKEIVEEAIRKSAMDTVSNTLAVIYYVLKRNYKWESSKLEELYDNIEKQIKETKNGGISVNEMKDILSEEDNIKFY